MSRQERDDMEHSTAAVPPERTMVEIVPASNVREGDEVWSTEVQTGGVIGAFRRVHKVEAELEAREGPLFRYGSAPLEHDCEPFLSDERVLRRCSSDPTPDEIERGALADAFLNGFMSSAEGFNGEYPFDGDQGEARKCLAELHPDLFGARNPQEPTE